MSGTTRETKTNNVLYDRGSKKDAIGNGYTNTTSPGWGSLLAHNIEKEMEGFGIPMEYIHTLFIQDNGSVWIKYTGRAGVTEKEMNIKRSDHEITDNQLRSFINEVVKDISEMVLETVNEVGCIYSNKIFYGDDVGLIKDKQSTCSILKEVTGMHGVCKDACYGGSSGGSAILPSDCRRCNIPMLFPTIAANIIRSKKGEELSRKKTT